MENFEYRGFRSATDSEVLEEVLKDDKLTKFFIPGKRCSVVLKDGDIVAFYNIGTVYGCPEISLAVREKYRGKGYSTEITDALTREEFKTGNPRMVYLRVNKDNKAGLAAAKKSGFHIDWELETEFGDNKEDNYYMLYRRY